MKLSSFITLSGLRLHAPVGVMPQEQVVGNDISIDLRIGYPLRNAMQSDDVADTLNYATVCDIVGAAAIEPTMLLEHLCQRIIDRLLGQFNLISSIDIKITKINPPMHADCDGAAVEIHLINDKTQR